MPGFVKVRPTKITGLLHQFVPTHEYAHGVWINIDKIESVSAAGTYTVKPSDGPDYQAPQSRIIFPFNGEGAGGYLISEDLSSLMKRIAAAGAKCADIPEPAPKKTTAKKTAAA